MVEDQRKEKYVVDDTSSPKIDTETGIANALRNGRAHAWRNLRHECL